MEKIGSAAGKETVNLVEKRKRKRKINRREVIKNDFAYKIEGVGGSRTPAWDDISKKR